MLTSKQLIDIGVKPGELFGKLLKCETIEEAITKWANREEKPKEKQVVIKLNSAWSYLVNNECLKGLCSREFPSKQASNAEKRRWLQNKSIQINNLKPGPDEILTYPVTQLIFFPNNNPITML